MANPAGDSNGEILRLDFDRRLGAEVLALPKSVESGLEIWSSGGCRLCCFITLPRVDGTGDGRDGGSQGGYESEG
jgi:hypothetical protein